MDISRVLMATINADHPQVGMRKAFDELFGRDNVRDFDYLELQRHGKSTAAINQEFVAAAISHKPDWIWLQVQETNILKADTIQNLKKQLPSTVITHWMGDCRKSVPNYLASICKATDVTFVSNTGQLSMFLEAGAKRAEYCQIGLDYEEDVLGLPSWTPPFKVTDVVFCGNHYGPMFPDGPTRLSAITALQKARVDIGVVGGGWPRGFNVIGKCEVKQQHHVYKMAKIALSISHFNNIGLYYSDRQLVSMASGTPVVCRYVPQLESEFVDDEHCLFFRTEEEMVSKVKSLLQDSQKRVRIGSAAKELVSKQHTWLARFQQILPIIIDVKSQTC